MSLSDSKRQLAPAQFLYMVIDGVVVFHLVTFSPVLYYYLRPAAAVVCVEVSGAGIGRLSIERQ